jgi:peptidoglycan/LPS O-acetylase OafA/YrhL
MYSRARDGDLFTLSGFLITTILLYRPSVAEFLIRRLCRIVPLAWLFTLIAVTLAKVSFHYYIAQILFFSNLPRFWADRLYGPLMEPVRRDAVLYRH